MKVKVLSGEKPQNNILTTKLPPSAIMGLLNMPSRYLETIDTGVSLKVPSGYNLRCDLVPELAKQGLLAIFADTTDTVKVTILNASRNIIVLGNGVPFVEVGLDKIVKVEIE